MGGAISFKGKVCVVTGASSGIGRRTAVDLASEGAVVCAVARREERLAALLEEIGSERDHSYFVADVARRDQVGALAEHVRSRYGRCHLLVNNAGFSGGGFEDEASIEALETIMATNFFGAVYCTGALLCLLELSSPSNVVNVASIAGRLAPAGNSAYAASKFALVGWSEALHFELAERGICVSVVEPGLIPTEGFPQSEFASSRLGRLFLGDEGEVSKAIREVASRGRLERVTPRWYYLLLLPRLLTPRLYWMIQRRIVKRFTSARARR